MRESPLPAFAGEAGLLDGRVVVAIAKCMALFGLRPEGGSVRILLRLGLPAAISDFEKVADRCQRYTADRSEQADDGEERNSAYQGSGPVISGDHEGEAQAESVERASVQSLSPFAPRSNCQPH